VKSNWGLREIHAIQVGHIYLIAEKFCNDPLQLLGE
jgi:hypothetical protein